jgi:dTDP-4-dehydrorhamnose 3,5-epimerase
MIEGVAKRKLSVIADERGYLMEILRPDWEEFRKFGYAYLTAVYPYVVKAWHLHRIQTDHFACISGMIKLVLYDARKESSTYGQINEFFIGDKNPTLVQIPPGVLHGFKGISLEAALIINVPTEAYNYENPDEERLPAHCDQVPYDWARKDG